VYAECRSRSSESQHRRSHRHSVDSFAPDSAPYRHSVDSFAPDSAPCGPIAGSEMMGRLSPLGRRSASVVGTAGFSLLNRLLFPHFFFSSETGPHSQTPPEPIEYILSQYVRKSTHIGSGTSTPINGSTQRVPEDRHAILHVCLHSEQKSEQASEHPIFRHARAACELRV
jgi:hypothetical protein